MQCSLLHPFIHPDRDLKAALAMSLAPPIRGLLEAWLPALQREPLPVVTHSNLKSSFLVRAMSVGPGGEVRGKELTQ